MDWLKSLIEPVLHFDRYLDHFLGVWGAWTYVLLFAIIFCETGLVVMPFLPGDSLLFAAGSFAALKPESLSVTTLMIVLTIAAILGDTVNYAIGAWIGPRAFSGKYWFLKQSHLEKTRAFYEKHGGKAIILARFVPIVRTFAPFVAGIGAMNYGKFVLYNIVGGVIWVVLFTMMGYLFGQHPFVKKNYELVLVAIIVLSVVPLIYEFAMSRRSKPAAEGEAPSATPVEAAD